MRPQYIVGIIIGLLLVYLGFMGAEGIGLSWSNASGLPSIEPFNDLGGWAVNYNGGGLEPIINPAGQLELHAGAPPPGGSAGGTDDRSAIRSTSAPGVAMSAATTLTITFRVMVDSWGSGGRLNLQLYTTSWYQIFDVYQSRIAQKGVSLGSYAGDNQWHNYSFSVTPNSKTDVFFDSTKVGTSMVFDPGVAAYYAGISIDAWDSMLCHVDTADVEPYLFGGGVTPPPGGYAAVTITVTGQGTTIPAAGTYSATYKVGDSLSIQATPGSGWSLKIMKRNGADWTSANPGGFVNLAAAENIEVVFVQGAPPDGGGINLGNFTGIIVNILNNGQVRQIEMVVGGLTTLITGIMFILPGKKYYPPPPPQPRYYQ
jgi:hypothetical protein